jgi:hypothetical protein
LLTRIALNRKALAVPIVDGLEWQTLEHKNIYGTTNFRGINNVMQLPIKF